MPALRILATTLCLLACGAAFAEEPTFAQESLPRAKPEDVGLSSERLARIGETLKADEMYFVTAPVFQTADDRYAWLNHVQAIAKAQMEMWKSQDPPFPALRLEMIFTMVS